MAENDLGDFFAKKDKRKKKKKQQGTKVTSATLIEQLISDTGKTEEQPQQQFTEKAHIARPDDNEWMEINDDHLAEGLSDLKIKSLDAKEEEEEAIRQEQEAQDYESEDENGEKDKGPWAPLSSSPPKTFSSINKPKANVPSIPSSLVSAGGKYIPPGQRAGGPAVSNSRSRGREQINVNSVDQFPGLHAQSNNQPKEKHDPTFDMAKGGGKRIQKQARPEQMQLNNKFQVLES